MKRKRLIIGLSAAAVLIAAGVAAARYMLPTDSQIRAKFKCDRPNGDNRPTDIYCSDPGLYRQQKQSVAPEPQPERHITLKRECPDEWIDNRQPRTVGDHTPTQYFIVDGQRHEIEEYDVEWVKANCSVKPEVVQ